MQSFSNLSSNSRNGRSALHRLAGKEVSFLNLFPLQYWFKQLFDILYVPLWLSRRFIALC